jgi:TPR repeat protein
MKRKIAAVGAALFLGLQVGDVTAGDLERAMQLYERQQYRPALDHFLAAAQSGNALAQEILGFMHAFGPALYPGVAADSRAALGWFDLAARNGRPVGRYMACAMARRVQDTRYAQQHCFDWVAQTGQPAPR